MKKSIRCLVVDDEKLAGTLLENYIGKLSNLELVALCNDPFMAIKVVQNEKIDLIFLDIQMPEMTGIEFLKTLPDPPVVIFTSAHRTYALEGYQLDVADFLVKPIRFDRFVQAVNKAARRILTETIKKESNFDHFPEGRNRDFLLVKSKHTTHRIFLDEIWFIEGMKEYVAFHLDGRRILALISLKQLEEELPSQAFLRIHKSFIISKDKVTAMDSSSVYQGKEELPIGSSFKNKVQQMLFAEVN